MKVKATAFDPLQSLTVPFPATVREPLLLSLCRVTNAQLSLPHFCNPAEIQRDLSKVLLIYPITVRLWQLKSYN